MCLLALLSLSSSSTCNSLTYSVENGVLTITGTGTITRECVDTVKSSISGAVIIESGVTAIESESFQSLTTATSLTLPPTLLRIGQLAFQFATVSHLDFPASLAQIDSQAFYSAVFNDTTIRLPASLALSPDAFEDARGIVGFAVDFDHPEYANDSAGCLYDKAGTSLLKYPSGSPITHFTAPGTVTSLGGPGVFSSSASLECVDLRATTITSVPDRTFSGCDSLRDVDLPATVQSLGADAFAGTALSRFAVPAGVRFIGAGAFRKCAVLSRVDVSAGNAHFATDGNGFLYTKNFSKLLLIPPGVPYGDIAIPHGVTELADSSCARVTAKSLALPDGLRTVADGAMMELNVSTIDFPDSVEAFGVFALVGAEITTMAIGGGVARIGQFAFIGLAIETLHYRGREVPTAALCNALAFVSIARVTAPPTSTVDMFCEREVVRQEGGDL